MSAVTKLLVACMWVLLSDMPHYVVIMKCDVTVQSNCADVPLRNYSLTGTKFKQLINGFGAEALHSL